MKGSDGETDATAGCPRCKVYVALGKPGSLVPASARPWQRVRCHIQSCSSSVAPARAQHGVAAPGSESGERDRAGEGCRGRERTERERAAEGESGQSGRGLKRERADRAGEGCRGRERTQRERAAEGESGQSGRGLQRERAVGQVPAVPHTASTLFTALSPRPRVQLGSTDVTKTERDKH